MTSAGAASHPPKVKGMWVLFGLFFHVLHTSTDYITFTNYDESTKKIVLDIRPPLIQLWLLEVHVY